MPSLACSFDMDIRWSGEPRVLLKAGTMNVEVSNVRFSTGNPNANA
jgi:hypothetical protein